MQELFHDWRTWAVIAYASFGLSLYHLTMAGYRVSSGDEENGLFHDRHRTRRRTIYIFAALGVTASAVLFFIAIGSPFTR